MSLSEKHVLGQSKWDDEDEEDVADAWDASEEEVEEVKPKPKAAPVKKKTTLQEKLALRKQQDELELQRKLSEKAESETEYERKLRETNSIMESDLENARALIGDLKVQPSDLASNLSTFNPASRPEFDEYVSMLSKKFATFESHPSYSYFVESLVRDMVVSLSLEDTRKLSSTLTAMINEKQKAQKTTGKKKKVKVSLQAAPRGDLDMTNYEKTYDEFDDFM